MKREEVKELIERYKEDGFELIDICLKDKKVIFINEKDEFRYDENSLMIISDESIFYIKYSAIEEIGI